MTLRVLHVLRSLKGGVAERPLYEHVCEQRRRGRETDDLVANKA